MPATALDSTIAAICRHVRDTEPSKFMHGDLIARWGMDAVHTCTKRGLIARQRWGNELTDYVDLTPAGESFLVTVAKRRLEAAS